jgi:hypothetical protein
MIGAGLPPCCEKTPARDLNVSIHSWARRALHDDLRDGEAQGFERLIVLRALLAEIVQQNKALRDAQELAGELQFLADNLDDDRDYAFMRP